MGVFNNLTAPLQCPHCGASTRVDVQFKYGNTWLLDYGLGERLRWGGNDIGEPGKRHVVVDGAVATPCASCGHGEEWDAYVHVENDVLTLVENADGRFDFAAAQTNYIVVSP